MNEELRSEIKRILLMAWKAVELAERHGGMTARGWAKSTYDIIKGDIQERYPDEDWD